MTAKNPAGPWSNPYYLPEAGGIDPSLFFDEDGKCYYIGTHPNPDGCQYDGDWYIWIRELDVEQMKLVGEEHNVWNGAMKGVHWPEGPHLYKIGKYYYIMHAEGGTGPDHAVTIAGGRMVYDNAGCPPGRRLYNDGQRDIFGEGCLGEWLAGGKSGSRHADG